MLRGQRHRAGARRAMDASTELDSLTSMKQLELRRNGVTARKWPPAREIDLFNTTSRVQIAPLNNAVGRVRQ